MSLPSSVAHYRIASNCREGVDSVARESLDNRFPRWLDREAGLAEAVIEWS